MKKFLALLTVCVMLVMTLASCSILFPGEQPDGGNPDEQPAHEHSFVDGVCECGESDPNYVPPHEHNFVEGKCECGETDPDYKPEEKPEEKPEDETPDEEPTPDVELSIFDKIMKTINELIAKLTAWFKNLFAGLKK